MKTLKKMNFLKLFDKKINPYLLGLNRKKLLQELMVHEKVVISRVYHGRA